ncbi:hypothetical protein [Streptomyces sp. WAC06614]|uniref:hypothetical protein n=1 Tax=Streptomyces sp. WAC06614 TaxID=2487416 RepID=UPI000F79E7B7|nr:hypothetical protein [Streptomyces sp. WAC06614]RSS81164.1 hypothetical protein EF918_11255 [Streptomyces sp. WAC06614]
MTQLIALYPRKYRQAHGEEISALYARSTEHAGPAARFREAADIAAHALRTRLGVTSAHYAGRAIAAAFPFLLATLAGQQVAGLADLFRAGSSAGFPGFWWPAAGVPVVLAAALICTVTGRWRSARLLVAAGAVLYVVTRAQTAVPGAGVEPADLLTAAVLVLALGSPPDLQPLPRSTRFTLGFVAAGAAAVQVLVLHAPPHTGLWQLHPAAAMTTVLALALAVAALRDRSASPAVTGILLAASLWSASAFLGPEGNTWNVYAPLAVATAGAVTAAVLPRLRPRTPGHQR